MKQSHLTAKVNNTVASDNSHAISNQDTIWSTPNALQALLCPSFHWRSQVTAYTRSIHVNKDFMSLTAFSLFFMVIPLLLAEINRYCNQHFNMSDKDAGWSRLPDMTVQETYVSLVTIILMGYDIRNTMKVQQSIPEQVNTPLYSNKMKCNHFFHILRFLHFCNNRTQPDMTERTETLDLTLINKIMSIQSFNQSEH
jgi:hypothetical protein